MLEVRPPQLAVLADAITVLLAQNKLPDARWHLAQLQIAAPAHLLGDVGRDVTRPAFGGVEADDAYGVVVLAGHQVLDDGFQIGRLEIGLAPHQAVSAEIVHHQIDIPIIVPGNDRRRPITQTRTPLDRTGIQAGSVRFVPAGLSLS